MIVLFIYIPYYILTAVILLELFVVLATTLFLILTKTPLGALAQEPQDSKRQLINLIVGGVLVILVTIGIFYYTWQSMIQWEKQNPNVNEAPIIQMYKGA